MKVLQLLITTALLFMLMAAPVFSYDATILSTNPSPVQAGEYADITIRIDTQGVSAQELGDFTLQVQETDFIKPVPGHERVFRALSPGQTITHTIRAYFSSNIPTGELPFIIQLEGTRSTFELPVPVYVSGSENKADLRIGTIQTTPDDLLQDTNRNTMALTLQNLGDKEAQLITATLRTNNSIISESYSYSMVDSLASLQAGEQATLQFDIDIEQTDLLQIPAELELRYRTQNDFDNSYTTLQETIPFDIRLVSAPRYEIIEMEPVREVQAGTSSNELMITIQNTGLEEARSVRLRLYPDPAVPFDFERTSIFISSNIKPGEEASLIVPFDVLDDAILQDYFVNAEIESLVGSTRYKQEARITIPVQQEASSGLSLYLIIIILFSLLTAAVIGFVYNRKKQ